MSGESRRGRPNRASKSAKVHPIKEDELPADELPCDVDAERFVLGAVLLDDTKFSEIAALAPDDFSLERHRRIFGAMRDLHDAGEAIDRVTED